MTTTYLFPSTLKGLADVSVSPGAGQDGYPLVWDNSLLKWTASPLPSVNGLRFPAAQVNSSGANTLDDYEEGIFNPVLADSPFEQFNQINTSGYSYDNSTGFYTKIGNLCTLSGFIGITGKPNRSADNWVYVTIPFLSTANWFADSQLKANSAGSYSGTWSTGEVAPLKVALFAIIRKYSSFSSGSNVLLLSDIQLYSRIHFSLTYTTN